MRQLTVVLDTNFLVSAMIGPLSVSGNAFRLAVASSTLLASEATLAEAQEVFLRDKFDRWIPVASRINFLADYTAAARIISVVSPIRVCRDERDDKFLSLALDGEADLIVSGDADLQVLHPFRGIAILSPWDYIQLVNGAQ